MNLWADLPILSAAARRPLPEADSEVDGLPPDERSLIATLWAERAENELGAGAVFAAVAKGLFTDGAPPEILWLASRAVCDELRHAEICRYVASRYGGTVPGRATPRAIVPPPIFAGSYAVLNGAMNETIGSAFLAACLEDAKGPLVRAALRELLTDETDHARLGWAMLAETPQNADTRREVTNRLPEMVGAARTAWRNSAASLPPHLPQGHGCLSRDQVLDLVDDALRSLVFPGLSHVGIDPSAVVRALDSGALGTK